MLGDSVLGYEEACWHCLFLAVPDPWGAAQRMLCKKNGTKLAGQENTKQDWREKGLECAPCLATCKCPTHSHAKLNVMHFFFQCLLIILFSVFLFGSGPAKSRLAWWKDLQPWRNMLPSPAQDWSMQNDKGTAPFTWLPLSCLHPSRTQAQWSSLPRWDRSVRSPSLWVSAWL